MHSTDNIQHQNFQEKRNRFHARFTSEIVRLWCANLMNIERKGSYCFSCVEIVEIPSKQGRFACETVFKFFAFFTVVCGLYEFNILFLNAQ